MARRKRSSAVLETARRRLAGLKSITPPPDFGGDLTLDIYEQEILNFDRNLNKYNELISALDQVQNNIDAEQGRLHTKSKRMLAATGARYGTDSNEYEAAGGTRDSERKPPTKKGSGNDSNS
jgi:hypothetical protein